MKKLLLILAILLSSCVKEKIVYQDTQSVEQKEINIMSFNIQVFGRSKVSKPDIMKVIIDIIDDYDLIAIQEIRDATDLTLTTLLSMMPPNYKLIAGPREGRSSSKEQAIFLYDDNKLNFINAINHPDDLDLFERSPYMAVFETDDLLLRFSIINVHLTPDGVAKEIMPLSEFAQQQEGRLLIVGDFNADGNYYNEKDLVLIFPEDKYDIIIGNDLDTTIAPSNNTYDRIIATDGFGIYKSGVLYFEDRLQGVKIEQVSDHYPVFAFVRY